MKSVCLFLLILFQLAFFSAAKGQDTRLITAAGLESRLSNGKDTTFVINFWATWCVPCIKELPAFEKLQNEFGDQKLKVILLSVDNRSKANSAVAAFIRKHRLKNEVFVADEQKPQNYIHKIDKTWSGSLPVTLIVNTSRSQRRFFEKEFTYPELVKEYKRLD